MIDTELTADLRAEGDARELQRAIQDLRKDAGARARRPDRAVGRRPPGRGRSRICRTWRRETLADSSRRRSARAGDATATVELDGGHGRPRPPPSEPGRRRDERGRAGRSPAPPSPTADRAEPAAALARLRRASRPSIVVVDQVDQGLAHRACSSRASRVSVVGDCVRLVFSQNTGALFGLFQRQRRVFGLVSLGRRRR